MIKAKVTGEQGTLLVFGLSAMNIQKLKEGLPIVINLAELGEKGRVMIFAGETEDSMLKDLQKQGLVPTAEAPTDKPN